MVENCNKETCNNVCKDNILSNLNNEEIVGELEEKYNLSANEVKEVYDRYIWYLEKCKELIERDDEKKVVKVDGVSQSCPVCNHPVNFNFCSKCGQRLKW